MSGMSTHQQFEYNDNLFAAITVQAGEGMLLVDTEGNYIFVNRAFCTMTGYRYEELTNMTGRDLLPPETEISLFAIVAHRETGSREALLVKKGGSVFLAEVKGSPLELDGRLLILGIISDITERRRNEMIVEKFFEQPMNLHVIAGFDGLIHRVNNGTESILGFTKDELEGAYFLDFVHPEDLEPLKREREVLEEGKTVFSFETRIRHKDGGHRLLAWSAIASMNDQLFYDAVANDISERRRAEDELTHKTNNLQEGLAKTKKLSGMLPICSSCKKIRDDDGYWNQIETHIREHSEAEFSRGLCPECGKKLYPGF